MDEGWRSIETVPEGTLVDIFYRNATFDFPVEGVLKGARRFNGFWDAAGSGAIPDQYAVSWRPSNTGAEPRQ